MWRDGEGKPPDAAEPPVLPELPARAGVVATKCS
jgi:hypothetical protein